VLDLRAVVVLVDLDAHVDLGLLWICARLEAAAALDVAAEPVDGRAVAERAPPL
jgi:hypothetical protein